MAESKKTKQDEPEVEGAPSEAADLPAVIAEGEVVPGTTKDGLDAGVPMKTAPGETFEGPEDAFDPDTRGDYSERIHAGPHFRTDPETGELVKVAPGA